jgi:hypothetical protein
MTQVGKILVIAITFLSICFLALSTVVFSTANNWKAMADKRQDEINKLQQQLNKSKAESETSEKALADARSQHAAEKKELEGRITALQEQNQAFQGQITAARTSLEKAEQNASDALKNAQARVEETAILRETLANLQSLTNRYKEAELALQDQVVELERDLEVAKNNNKDLRERAALLSAIRGDLELLRAEMARPNAASPSLKARTTRLASMINQGLSDPNQVRILEGPPAVLQGEVIRVDERNRFVEISVGSDDGLIPGHRMFLSRTSPRPEYVGDITIQSVEPDRALAKIDNLYLGRKPQEGDLVKPKNAGR